MKREIEGARIRLDSAIKRLEDLEVIHPGAALSLENVAALDLRPALEALDYIAKVIDE